MIMKTLRKAYYHDLCVFLSIISVITDAILARCTSSPQPPGENRVTQSIALKKIGSVGNWNHRYFFRPYRFSKVFLLLIWLGLELGLRLE
jgi:hypothetical protein